MTPTAILDPVDGEVIFAHDCLAECGDGVTRLLKHRTYVLGVPPWAVVQREPLTLAPSIDCGACPVHGFIRAGQWVAA